MGARGSVRVWVRVLPACALANGSSRFGACFGTGLTCLCTGQWKLVFGCGFDLFVYWPMGARGSVRVEGEEEESRVESRVELSRERKSERGRGE